MTSANYPYHAVALIFSEIYRSIRLDRFVYGFPLRSGNVFAIKKPLDWKYDFVSVRRSKRVLIKLICCNCRLLHIIVKHDDDKPVLVVSIPTWEIKGTNRWNLFL